MEPSTRETEGGREMRGERGGEREHKGRFVPSFHAKLGGSNGTVLALGGDCNEKYSLKPVISFNSTRSCF